MAVIKVEGIEIDAVHGVNPDEKVYPQPFVVDISVHLDVRKAAKSDELVDTINYASLQKIAYQVLLGTPEKPAASRNLIETLSFDILQAIHRSDERIIFAKVKLHKPKAPLSRQFTDVSITVSSDDLV